MQNIFSDFACTVGLIFFPSTPEYMHYFDVGNLMMADND
jgi:hypothetical protein